MKKIMDRPGKVTEMVTEQRKRVSDMVLAMIGRGQIEELRIVLGCESVLEYIMDEDIAGCADNPDDIAMQSEADLEDNIEDDCCEDDCCEDEMYSFDDDYYDEGFYGFENNSCDYAEHVSEQEMARIREDELYRMAQVLSCMLDDLVPQDIIYVLNNSNVFDYMIAHCI